MGAPERQGELYCPTCEQTFVGGDRCPSDNTRLVRIAAPVDSLIGRELDGRYTIIEKLGQGGMGSVYRGTQHSVGRDIAIKVVTPSLVSDPDVIKRFLREAKLSSRLAHPNAVAVLDFGQTDDNLFYLVMELVAGRTLERVVEEGMLTPARLVRIGVQICDALEGAHALGIVHRDLKPQNVMVLSTGRDLVKVLDFGIAKSLTPDHSSTTITNAGALLGTPAYMPPELVSGRSCDGRADLYSLGCVLFAAGTGKLPFEATTVNELIAMHACEPAPPAEGLPPRLQAVIGRLLEKDPGQRFHSASATRDALEASLGGVVEVEPEPEADQSTRLGWSGQFTAPAKGQRRATPVSGVRQRAATPAGGSRAPIAAPLASSQTARITPAHSARIGLASVPEDQLDLYASSETLLADSVSSLPKSPAPAPARSRKGMLVALGGGLVLAAGLVTFVLVRGGGDGAGSALPTKPAPARTEPTKTEPAKVAPAPSQPPMSSPSLTTPIPTPPVSDNAKHGERDGGIGGTTPPKRPRIQPASPNVADKIERPPNRTSSPLQRPAPASKNAGGAEAGGNPAREEAPSRKVDKKVEPKPEPPRPVTINPGVE